MNDSLAQGGFSHESADEMKDNRFARSRPGERRIVTIMFCDVTGSTAMAENLDPEDWAEIMDEAFDYLTAPIERFEGKVARLMGDAILAFFGAPVSHEDDPQRAILAGLDIVKNLQPFRTRIERDYGLDFNVRVGINTGEVVVGEIGSEQAVEYTAMGDAVNMAARMEQTAQPGTVQISEDAYRLVAPLFNVESLGSIEVKGKQEPEQAYRVLGRKEQPGRLRGIEGLSAPLVGRDREFETMREALADVSQGRGQILCLIGEAGLGKSRLIEEMRVEWERNGGRTGLWIDSRGISYDTNQPYSLFRQQVQKSCGISENDPPEVARKKIMQSFPVAVDEQGEKYQEMIHAIEVLLAVEAGSERSALEGEALKRELTNSVLNMYQRFISTSPLVVVCDDLHWADPASVELLVHLFQITEEAPVLFLCALRPYRKTPGWQVKLAAETDYPHRYQEINLHPLSNEDSGTLVDNLLVISELPEELRQLILRKTEGNPFFVEEVVRTLLNDGSLVRDKAGQRWRATRSVEDISIPDNLQALVVARIDRLDEGSRRTLQLAAVIGRSFYYRVLNMISELGTHLDRQLNNLERVELIREQARQPELEYTFLHELTRDAAYDSILRRNRRLFHRRVGEAIEQLFPDKLDQETHRLAYHFQQAGDLGKALKYATLAGDIAFRLYANQEAVSHYSQAIEVALKAFARGEVTNEQLIYLFERKGRALELYGQYGEALAHYQELEALGVEHSASVLRLAALLFQATIYSIPTMNIDYDKGSSSIHQALSLARQLGDHRAEAKALWLLMLLEEHAGQNPHKAIEHGEEALNSTRNHGLKEQLAYVLNDISRVRFGIGQSQAAWASLEESQALWRELDNKAMLADSLGTMADAYLIAGEIELSFEKAEQGLELSRSIHNLWGQSYIQSHNSGNALSGVWKSKPGHRYPPRGAFAW